MTNQAKVPSLLVRTTLSFFVVVLSSVVPGRAQVHGVPPSAPSVRTTPVSKTMGLPMPVTSFGPRGPNLPSCRRGSEGTRSFGHPDVDHGHGRSGHRIIPIVYTYYPYIQPPMFPSEEASQNPQPEASSTSASGSEQSRL